MIITVTAIFDLLYLYFIGQYKFHNHFCSIHLYAFFIIIFIWLLLLWHTVTVFFPLERSVSGSEHKNHFSHMTILNEIPLLFLHIYMSTRERIIIFWRLWRREKSTQTHRNGITFSILTFLWLQIFSILLNLYAYHIVYICIIHYKGTSNWCWKWLYCWRALKKCLHSKLCESMKAAKNSEK